MDRRMVMIDQSTNYDFLRLQSLQMSQVSEMNDLQVMMNKNFMELGKKIADLYKNHKEKPQDATLAIDQANQPYSRSIVDLDSPPYATAILQDSSYTPAKHLKVSVPRFDDTDVEH